MKALRTRAEAALASGQGNAGRSNVHDLVAARRELQLHELELVMQNDELLRTRRELDESRRRYHELFDDAPIAYVAITRDGAVAEANARAATLLDVPAARLRGMELRAFVAPRDVSRFDEHRRRAFEEGRTAFDISLRGKLSREIRVRFETTVKRAGDLARVAIVDLTELEEAHAALGRAQKMDALGALATGVAHDFNNVLMALQGSIEMLRERGSLDESARMLLDEMRACVERASTVTARLRTLSRTDGAPATVLDLGALVSRSVDVLRRVVGDHIELALTPCADDARVRVAAGDIEQVLLNLVVNARDALPGGGRIEVSTRIAELDATTARTFKVSPGRYVELRVHDDGRGIPEHVAARLFEPFFTTKGPGKGTGLGLAIVQKILATARGGIRVVTGDGVGTAFAAVLPLSGEPLTEATEEPAVKPSPRGDETVLVVEDDPLVRTTTKYRLERAGYRVLEAASPAEAVECVARFPGRIALVLTDFALPGGDGADVARELRQLRPTIAVLMMSAYDVSENHDRFAGAVIQKPFSAETLLDTVRRVLDQPTPDAPLPAASEAKRTLLLVEDNDSARVVLTAYLERLGWSVEAAASAASATKLFRSRSEPPEVLLTDYELPDRLGRELARELRLLAPTLRVAYLTGHDGIDGIEPGDPVLKKPLELPRLAKALDGLVPPVRRTRSMA